LKEEIPKKLYVEDTIVAPATLVGESSITVIRVSGKDTFKITDKIFSINKNNVTRKKISLQKSHTAHHGYIMDGSKLVDEVVLTIFQEPHSFTGENVAEISLHGGKTIYRKVISILIKKGCRLAEPGEFSKRAFLNQKTDLIKTESIAALIRADTDKMNSVSLNNLKGKLSENIENLRKSIIDICSLVELEIDFSEEEIRLIDNKEFKRKLKKIILSIDKLLKSYNTGKKIQDGIKVAITGKPNTGKSSIFNYLINDSRAIVSEIPGTTRDYLEEAIFFGGFKFIITDTAGIRKAHGKLEKIGINKSIIVLNQADFLLNVLDATKERTINKRKSTNREILVYNKIDIINDKRFLKNRLSVSAITGENMEKLEKLLVQKAKKLTHSNKNSDILLTSVRQYELLSDIKIILERVLQKQNILKQKELMSLELREAVRKLDVITGKITNEEILNNIFSTFCIGK
jgi:tRNA modification GTPase